MTSPIPTTWPSTNDRGYTIPDQPYGTLKPLKVIAVGAGMSGISLAHGIKTKTELIDLTIYESAPEVGGTWYWNTYPGCRCDIPSVIYQMPWAPKTDWNEYYSPASDVLEYYVELVNTFDLRKYIRFSHTVIRAEWDAKRSKWCISVQNPDGHVIVDECDVFFNTSGVLNRPKLPNLPAKSKFKGALVHTARWPKDLILDETKTVAVLGGGASGVQHIVDIQPKIKKMYHWIRSPSWFSPPGFSQYANPDRLFTREQQERFKNDPQHYLKFRKLIEYETLCRFKGIVLGTPEQKAILESHKKTMYSKLEGHERLQEALIPKDFAVGCQRPLTYPQYLDALCAENVTVFTEPLKEMTETGFIDAQGVSHEVDVFVCATGFDTSYRPPFPVVAEGVNLQDKWADYPYDSYLSTFVQGYPNYITYYGPFGGLGHGSTASVIDSMTYGYMQILQKIQFDHITTISVKPDAVKDYNEHQALFVKRTVWSGPCSSWSKPETVNENLARDQAPSSCFIFPGNRLLYIEMLRNVRWEDFDYTYDFKGNRFGYLGNGFTTREQDGRDPTYYAGLLDGKDEWVDFDDIKSMYPAKSSS